MTPEDERNALLYLDDMRNQLVSAHIKIGAPEAIAREIVDLAIHATRQATITAARVIIASSGPEVETSATHLSLQLLAEHCTQAAAELSRRQQEHGVKVSKAYVSMDGSSVQ